MARRSANSKSVKVNFKDVESRKTPPEGDYIATVLEAKNEKSGNGNDQIAFTAEITEGEYKGSKMWLYCPLTENSLWKLHAFLSALGEEPPADEVDIDLEDLVGKEFVATLTHETYQGRKRAKLTDFCSVEEFQGEREGKGKKKKDKDAKEDKSSKKPGKDDAKGGKKKAKKVKASDVADMDEDELKALVKEHKLDVTLKGLKLKKQVAAVKDALEEADLLNDDE